MKILVAENEPEVLRLYITLLEDEGHEVFATKDGLECINAYKNALGRGAQGGGSAFDLVILDHKMPNMTGVEAANEILGLSPTQRILMITAFAGELQIKDKHGKVKILRKPVDVEELISFVVMTER